MSLNEKDRKRVIALAQIIAIILLFLGLLIYGFMLFVYSLGLSDRIVDIVNNWPSKAFDIPMAGIVAFGIVSLLQSSKDNTNHQNNSLYFKAFSLEFTGPAVPTILWVFVFLSIVISFKLLS